MKWKWQNHVSYFAHPSRLFADIIRTSKYWMSKLAGNSFLSDAHWASHLWSKFSEASWFIGWISSGYKSVPHKTCKFIQEHHHFKHKNENKSPEDTIAFRLFHHYFGVLGSQCTFKDADLASHTEASSLQPKIVKTVSWMQQLLAFTPFPFCQERFWTSQQSNDGYIPTKTY